MPRPLAHILPSVLRQIAEKVAVNGLDEGARQAAREYLASAEQAPANDDHQECVA